MTAAGVDPDRDHQHVDETDDGGDGHLPRAEVDRQDDERQREEDRETPQGLTRDVLAPARADERRADLVGTDTERLRERGAHRPRLLIAHLVGLHADRLLAARGSDRGDLRRGIRDHGVHCGRGLSLVGIRHTADGELRPAGELDRQLDRAEERDERRTDHEKGGDDEPQPAPADERERGLAGVQVVAELIHGTHQSSPSVVERLPEESPACLRSAIVCRRSASPRERPVRRAAEPLTVVVSTAVRNCARPR